jgi:hypothetical protein
METTPLASPFNDLPKWVKVVSALGFPVVVAIWVLNFIINTQTAQLDAQGMLLQTHVAQSAIHDDKVSTFLGAHAESEAIMRAILSQICANGAANATERAGCFPQASK